MVTSSPVGGGGLTDCEHGLLGPAPFVEGRALIWMQHARRDPNLASRPSEEKTKGERARPPVQGACMHVWTWGGRAQPRGTSEGGQKSWLSTSWRASERGEGRGSMGAKEQEEEPFFL